MQNIKFEVIKKIVDTKFKVKDISSISKLDSNSPPSIFIGSKLRYPNVNVGILSPLERDENAWLYDDVKFWSENNFQIEDVLKIRESLLNSRFRSSVKDSKTNNKFVNIAKEIALASKPVDLEIELNRGLSFNSKKDKVLTPHGMNAGLKKAKITSNTRIHRKVEKVMGDDLKASDGLKYLYKNKFDEYTLSKILSVGVLGLKNNKRLVPTRWSITATDDTLGKQLIENVKDYRIIENYELFFGEFLGNQYLIFLFPNVFSYELFELYMPGSSWNPSSGMKASTDFESFFGRTTYASSTAGGYYAARLPILEYLNNIKRQASILVIRLETPGYWAGLGVWVCREACRKTLNNRFLKFFSEDEIINSAKIISKKKFNTDIDFIFEKSKLITQLRQRRITEFF